MIDQDITRVTRALAAVMTAKAAIRRKELDRALADLDDAILDLGAVQGKYHNVVHRSEGER